MYGGALLITYIAFAILGAPGVDEHE